MCGDGGVRGWTGVIKCITCHDYRLQQLHGYSKGDLIGRVPFEFHHHDDIKITLQCSQGCMYACVCVMCV